MRLPTFGFAPILALALTALAGCSPSSEQGARPELLDQAIDAYVAADGAALAAIDAEAKAQKAAAVATPGFADGCTVAAASARRVVISAALIEGLDQPRLMSMSDTARYVNFVNVANWRGKGAEALEPGPECADHQMLAVGETGARVAIMKTMLTRVETWRDDLRRQYGAELTPRLNEAGKLLERNGFDAGDWAPASRSI
jgi:hypothetical protein